MRQPIEGEGRTFVAFQLSPARHGGRRNTAAPRSSRAARPPAASEPPCAAPSLRSSSIGAESTNKHTCVPSELARGQVPVHPCPPWAPQHLASSLWAVA